MNRLKRDGWELLFAHCGWDKTGDPVYLTQKGLDLALSKAVEMADNWLQTKPCGANCTEFELETDYFDTKFMGVW